MKVVACKEFSSTRLGNIGAGRVLDLPEGLARQYLERKLVTVYETKVIPHQPVAGPLSASPPAQASPQTTASVSDAGKPKRRRRKAESSSSSTKPGDSAPDSLTTCTLLMASGGDTSPEQE